MNASTWEFRLPTAVEFGDGLAERLPERARAIGGRPVLVTDRGLAAQSFMTPLLDAFGTAPRFTDIEPNPTTAAVEALAAVLRAQRADVVVAIGGGSVLDCAKAACCLARSALPGIAAAHTGGQPLGADRIPLVAVPTTAGTGSEVTPFAVLDDPVRGVKAPLSSPALYPLLAVVDPLLTHGLPRALTAATGLDALSHAIEGYWSRRHQPLCDLLALEAGRLICRWFETVCREPAHAEGRRAMSYAATLAGMAFQLPRNAMVHACSYPLSRRYHLPHGVACALTLPAAIRFNAPAMAGRMEVFAAACGCASAAELADAVTRFRRLGGLPGTLREAGIPREDIPALVAASFHPLMQNNPRPVTPADLTEIYAERV